MSDGGRQPLDFRQRSQGGSPWRAQPEQECVRLSPSSRPHASPPPTPNLRLSIAFQQPDEDGKRTLRVYRSSPTRHGGTRALLFISDLKVNTDGTKVSYSQDDPTAASAWLTGAAGCAINNIRNAFRTDAAGLRLRACAMRYPEGRTWQLLSPSIIEATGTARSVRHKGRLPRLDDRRCRNGHTNGRL